MKLSIGIVGLPNVGKSTLFNYLTNQSVTVANYPFATIDPNVGIVPVPDERIDKLAEISHSGKKIPAVVEFYDIAGLVKNASKGEGLGNQFLGHIKAVNAVVHVLRCFKNDDIIHVEEGTDPKRDMEIINTELALKDLDVIEKRVAKIEGEARSGSKEAKAELEILTKIKSKLEAGESVLEFQDNELAINFGLLSIKKRIYLLNGDQPDIGQELIDAIATEGADYIIQDLSKEASLDELIQKAYQVLGLISFFTTGEMETRAWTIRKGSKAPVAAGTIHTDFQNKFIRAEVVGYEDFVSLGGWNQAKQGGKLGIEGKEYVVEDGDILVIRHS